MLWTNNFICLLFHYRAAKQHQKQQEKTAKHFNDLLPPSFLSGEERNQASSQQLPRSRNELFGTQYHPSKYSRDPETLSGTIQISSTNLTERQLMNLVSASRHDRSSGVFQAHPAGSENLTWDIQLQPHSNPNLFSREAPPPPHHARPATESPPYGVANC